MLTRSRERAGPLRISSDSGPISGCNDGESYRHARSVGPEIGRCSAHLRAASPAGVTPWSYTWLAMPSKHPRIAVTADQELADALERVRVATGTQEADATLVRRLAVEGAQAELEACHGRRAAAEALMALMDRGGFDLDLDAIDRLNEPTRAPP